MNRQQEQAPFVSVIIPAWNEELLMPRLLDSIDVARSRYSGGPERIEVIVADNASTDQTAAMVRARGNRVEEVTTRCISAVRNGGAAVATGDVLAFVNADFAIAPETFDFIAKAMASPGVVGGGTGVVMNRWSCGVWTCWLLYMVPLWVLGQDGGVWFCRRSDFHMIGGFDEALRAGEDVRFLRDLARLGRSRTPRERLVTRFSAWRMGLQPALAVESTRKSDQYGDWHLLRGILWNLPARLWGKQRNDSYVDSYWYQVREPSSTQASSDRRRSSLPLRR